MNAFAKRNEMPISCFHQGSNFHAYELLGSRSSKRKGVSGVVFRVWAPHAKSVSVVGDFNLWNRAQNPMDRINEEGLWEAFLPGIKQGEPYQYSVEGTDGTLFLKSDPYAYYRAEGKSAYYDLSRFNWKDGEWMEQRKLHKHLGEAINIYEVHAGSWKRNEDGSVLNFRKLADELVPYVADMGYTHLQLLPVMEHKQGSWGYEVTGYYAPDSRYGTPKDFMYLVNKCHEQGIGIIVDWVPGHFPKDEQGMALFDGSACYEYENTPWESCFFDLSRPEVSCFLISNAMYWLEKYHIDGLRVDSVSAMLYLGSGQEQRLHTRETREAVDFLKRMNTAVLSDHPDVLMIAEESSAWPMVTKPPYAGGLGFSFKWNSGWSHDILHYMSLDPTYRSYNHDKITFSLMYAFSENFVLPLSHDEVSNGKGSLLSKMPGEHNQKFAGVRTLLGYMMAHPGKKLQFMGNEFGQFVEWNDSQPLDWHLLDYDSHRKLKQYVRDLNYFYRDNPPLWEIDNSWDGFQWLVHDDQSQCVAAFRRTDEDGRDIIAICNFAPVQRDNYRIGIPQFQDYEIVMNSDEVRYGGSGLPHPEKISAEYTPMHGKPYSIRLDIPAMSVLFLAPPRREEKKAYEKGSAIDAVITE